MTACTDDERRRVAERLRRLNFPSMITLMSILDVSGRDMCARLADLIDPDSYPNLGTQEARTSQVPKCDRAALMALEDEMFEDATGLAFISQLEKNEELQDLQSTMAKALMDYAHRIREACGEAVA